MCGILGGLSFSGNYFPDKEELHHASDFLKHRGPDDEGTMFLDIGHARLCMAHRRLSIIDLSSAGHQPMVSASGESIIVFNGEIYNYKTLKAELMSNGYRFRSNSDTEVILAGYECWGIDRMLQNLDGMFAFALFDKRLNACFLARDRFGKKPLYYFSGENRIAFSSDIRSFGKIKTISLTVDLHALGYFFAELSTPHEATIWKEVKKLKPGSYLKFDRGGISAYKPFWQLYYSEDCALNREDIIEKTEFLLSEAVKKRLVADVNVSALLSGGIDSSLIVAKMAEHSTGSVKTYSVGFKEDQFNELPYARQVANKFDTYHTELVVDPASLESINDLIWEYGEPFADSSMIPTYLMSKEISKNEKVVLGGDGGDELFGGYYSHYFAYKFDSVKKLKVLHPLAELLNRFYPTYRTNFFKRLLDQAKLPAYTLLNRNLGFSEHELKMLFNNEVFFKSLESEHKYIWQEYSANSKNELINTLSTSLKTRLLNDYLVKIDRASMYASLEMRSPFLDKNIAEFTATLKPEQLFHRTGTKSILRAIAEKYFGKSFTYRNKMGFGVPLGDWFRSDLAHSLKDVVLGGKQTLVEMNYGFIEHLLEEHISGVSNHEHKVWSLYVFHAWAQNQ